MDLHFRVWPYFTTIHGRPFLGSIFAALVYSLVQFIEYDNERAQVHAKWQEPGSDRPAEPMDVERGLEEPRSTPGGNKHNDPNVSTGEDNMGPVGVGASVQTI